MCFRAPTARNGRKAASELVCVTLELRSMESFPGVAGRVLQEFRMLLQHGPSLLGSTHMLQITTINMFTIHNNHSRGQACPIAAAAAAAPTLVDESLLQGDGGFISSSLFLRGRRRRAIRSTRTKHRLGSGNVCTAGAALHRAAQGYSSRYTRAHGGEFFTPL